MRIMARKRRKRSDFKQVWVSDYINKNLDLGKTIHYKFGVDCFKFMESFNSPSIGFNYTKGSKDDVYRHDRNTIF